MELAGALHVSLRACRIRTPTDKGGVERGIRYLKTRFFPARVIPSLEAGNAALKHFLETVAMARRHPVQKQRTVAEVFAEERARLLPLPRAALCTELVTNVPADKTALVSFDTNRYSVPPKAANRILRLVARDVEVRLLDGELVVARHARSWAKNTVVEDPAHRAAIVANRPAARDGKGRDRLRVEVRPSSDASVDPLRGSPTERQGLRRLDSLQVRNDVEVPVDGDQHVELRVLHHSGVQSVPSTQAGVHLQEAAGVENVVGRDGKDLRDQAGRGANGACGVGHVHTARPDVEDLLQDLAAGDAVELSLSDGLKDVAAGSAVWAIGTEGVQKDVRVDEEPSHGGPRVPASERSNRAKASLVSLEIARRRALGGHDRRRRDIGHEPRHGSDRQRKHHGCGRGVRAQRTRAAP